MNPPQPPQRLFKFGCITVLVLLCLLAAVLPALWSYWSSVKEERRLTFEEITEILKRKPLTLKEFLASVETASTKQKAEEVRTSSLYDSAGQDGVREFVVRYQWAFTNERGAKPISDSTKGPRFHEMDVVDVLYVVPDDPRVGSGGWGSGGSNRGWYLIVGFGGMVLGTIHF